MRGSTTGIAIDSTNVSQPKLSIVNSIIHNSTRHLVSATNAQLNIVNSQLSNAGGSLLYLMGGETTVTHCTFANHYKFDVIKSPLVVLSNYRTIGEDAQLYYPLGKANFYNTIINGAYTDVGLYQSDDKTVSYNFLFDHCLLKSNGEDDANFIETLWGGDPQFVNIGEDYLFDFQLDSLSVARNAGNRQWAMPPANVDMFGNSRLINEKPDLGAYQWVESE